MGQGINKFIGIGNLTKDVEVRYTQGGAAVASFSIACNESWKDKNTGEKKERVEFINCTAFGHLAEICGQYLQKGSQIYVEGRLQTDSYEKDGVKKYSTKIIVNQMQMLGGKSDGNEPPQATPATPPKTIGDDIPF